MTKVRLKQLDETELSGYIEDVLTGTISGIEDYLDNLNSTGVILSGEYGAISTAVNILSGQNTGISGRLSTIETDFAAFDISVSSVSGQLAALSTDISDFEIYLGNYSGDLVALQSGQSDMLVDISALETQNVVTSGNLASLTGYASGISGNTTIVSGVYNTFTGNYVSGYVMLMDVSGSGVPAGTFSGNIWVARNINTEVTDANSLCTLGPSGYQFTLAAGTYRCDIMCPAYSVDSHIAILYNVTSGGVLLSGSTSVAAANSFSHARTYGQFVLTGSSVLEIRHRCGSTGYATYGLGPGSMSGIPNIFTTAEFTRIKS